MPTLSFSRTLATSALALGGALLAACSDAPLAPRADAAPDLAREYAAHRTALASTDRPSFNVAGTATDTLRTSFTYYPAAGATLWAGPHKLVVPAYGVCDPATSGYGPATWDRACAALTTAKTFSVKAWTDAAGHPRIRVTPDVRFVPTRITTLYFYDRAAALDPSAAFVWCPSTGGACVNESLRDASLKLKRDLSNTYVYGRVKHFSGYNVVVDRADGGSDDGTGFGY
jgi:hypothetical protein